MIIIKEGSNIVNDQIQTGFFDRYRLSNFVIKETLNIGYLLYNTLNGYLVYVNDTYDLLSSMPDLIKLYYYIRIDFDEYELVRKIRIKELKKK